MLSFPDLALWQLALAFVVCIFGGFTKGVTGFALPLIMVSGMASFIDPDLAIASIVIPTVLANFWQALQHGIPAAIEAFRKYALLICTTLVMIFIHAQWIGGLDRGLLLGILGVSIIAISLIQIIGVKLHIKPAKRQLGAGITGIIGGFFGALSGTWGPPTIIYLMAIDTPKKEQVRTAGITFGLGALVFAFAHGKSGLITMDSLGFSLYLLIPVVIGQFLGAKAQDKIDQALFRKATLWVLLIAGANVLRKALMG